MAKSEKSWTSTNPLIDDDNYEDMIKKQDPVGADGGIREIQPARRGGGLFTPAGLAERGETLAKTMEEHTITGCFGGAKGNGTRPEPTFEKWDRVEGLDGRQVLTGYQDIDAFLYDCLDTMKKKGHDYRQGNDDDVLHNFRTVAETVGTDMMKVWFTYFYKHFSAMATFIKEGGQSESEPIEGRIKDQIVYLLLFYRMVQEHKQAEYNRAATEHGIIT